MKLPPPPLAKWQFWISLIQLLISLIRIGLFLYYILANLGVAVTEALPLVYVVWFVYSIVAALNDFFMITIDFKRTNMYLGCIAAQSAINVALISLSIYISAQMGTIIMFEIIPSFCLLVISLWPIVRLRTSVPITQIWKINTKDAFSGTVPSGGLYTPSILGRRREAIISRPFPTPVSAYRSIKQFLINLFFRRVKPAENLVYAFIRNFFAVAAMAFLIFRTFKAMMQAENEISTRVTSESCKDAAFTHSVSILMDRLVYDSSWNNPSLGDINITIQVLNRKGITTDTCSREWSHPFKYEGYGAYQDRILEFFRCPNEFDISIWGSGNYTREYWNPAAYRIEARPAAGTLDRSLFGSQIHHIWLMNSRELNSTDLSQSNLGEVRAYLPPFKPLLGSHTTAEANLITRRLIKSSIMKETLSVAKPEYRTLSLYPIVESSVTTVNSSDVNMTIATIHPSLTSGRMYHRNRPENWNPKDFLPNVCDYIEDYRSSTIFDVIGSVGGLFALLQTAHMLLFGRPLFWGLFGAMTITPFGLLGRFSSSGFKQRLSEEYHGRSDDGTGTIKIDKFLRDFVIDFGPADRDLQKSPNTETMPLSAALVSPDDESTSKVVLLAQMSPDAGGTPRKEDDVGREPYP